MFKSNRFCTIPCTRDKTVGHSEPDLRDRYIMVPGTRAESEVKTAKKLLYDLSPKPVSTIVGVRYLSPCNAILTIQPKIKKTNFDKQEHKKELKNMLNIH